MRQAFLLAAAGAALAGCVAQPYAPGYYAPGRYDDPYRDLPPPTYEYRRALPPLDPFPGARLDPYRALPPEPLPQQLPELRREPLPQPEPPAETGPIPLIEMPAPAPETAPRRPADNAPRTAPSPQQAPVVQGPPTSGPGSNVPLEGFRPMRGQTKPTP